MSINTTGEETKNNNIEGGILRAAWLIALVTKAS